MARPRERDGERRLGLRLNGDVYDRLAAAADERELSMNWLATRAIEEYLDRLVPVDEIVWTREA